jgi:hypothetical protein
MRPRRRGSADQGRGGRGATADGAAPEATNVCSRHSSIATLMLYVDEPDRQRTQQTLADLVAGNLTA